MNVFTAFVVGLLVGWLIEWAMDRFYWRAQGEGLRAEAEQLRARVLASETRSAELEEKLGVQSARSASLEAGLTSAAARAAELDRHLALQAENAAGVQTTLAFAEARSADLESELAEFKAGPAASEPVEPPLLESATRAVEGFAFEMAEPVIETAEAAHLPDDLVIIKGIGKVIAGKLNHAGITTFAQLGALSVPELRAIVGDGIARLADEEDLLAQARALADAKIAKG